MEEISNGWFKLPFAILICMYMGNWERRGYCSLTLVVSQAQFPKAKIICNLNLVLFIRKKRMTKGFPVWGHSCVSNPLTERMVYPSEENFNDWQARAFSWKVKTGSLDIQIPGKPTGTNPFCNSALQLQSVQNPCMSVCVHIYLQKVINLWSSGQLFTKY